MTLKVFEGFCGYGGCSFGLERSKISYEIVGYSEIDDNAIKLYTNNFKNVKNYGDIKKINEKILPDFDLFSGGFPCQPFSTGGKGLGITDQRGQLIYDIIRIIEYKKPKYVLLENVKGLLSKNMLKH